MTVCRVVTVVSMTGWNRLSLERSRGKMRCKDYVEILKQSFTAHVLFPRTSSVTVLFLGKNVKPASK